jgi:lipid-A-disaccharide synthase-like uncharacterized protein
LAYLPEYGVGYFYSINTSRGDAFEKIGKAIRTYVTRELRKPPLPAAGSLPEAALSYAGWYEFDSPRMAYVHYIGRLAGRTYMRFKEGKMLLTGIGGNDQKFVPVIDMQFRAESLSPVATIALFTPQGEGQFAQFGGMMTMKRIPSWLAITEIALAIWVALAVVSVLVYAPCWLLNGLWKKRRRPSERGMRVWPLLAVLSFGAALAIIYSITRDDLIASLGNLTVWSAALSSATIAGAGASVASLLALWRASPLETRRTMRVYSLAVSLALLICTAYLAYWGVIGIRTWA